MKKISMLLLSVAAIAFLGCSKSSDPSPTSAVNERLTAVSTDGGDVITLSYDDQGRVKTITSSDGSEPFDLYYLAGDIKGSLTGDTPQSYKDIDLNDDRSLHVYNVTMTNGNPTVLKAYSMYDDYNPSTGQFTHVTQEFVIHIAYDGKINPLYLVLDQSQMIPTIDTIVLASPDPAYTSLNAGGLFSVNNPTKIEFFDTSGALLEPATTISYQYDAAGLPTKAVSSDGGVVNFTYTPK